MTPLGRVWGYVGVRPIRERAGSAKPTTELRRRITAQQGILGGSVVGCPLKGSLGTYFVYLEPNKIYIYIYR